MGVCVSTGEVNGSKNMDLSNESSRIPVGSRSRSPVRSARQRLRESIDFGGTNLLKGLKASSNVGYAAAKPVALHIKNRAKAIKRLSVDLSNLIVHRKPASQDLAYGMRKVQQHYAPFANRKSKDSADSSHLTSGVGSIQMENAENRNGEPRQCNPNSYEAIASAHLENEGSLQHSSEIEHIQCIGDEEMNKQDFHSEGRQLSRYSGPEPLNLSDVPNEEPIIPHLSQDESEKQHPNVVQQKPKKRLPRRFGAGEDSIEEEANRAGLKHHLHEVSVKKQEQLKASQKVEKVLNRIIDGPDSVKFSQHAAVHRIGGTK